MYWGDHAPPHFHATAEGIWVVIAIRTLETLEGGLSPRHMELVLQWQVCIRRRSWRHGSYAQHTSIQRKLHLYLS
ncbi:DUF4160 domain-containing protein [Granulicella paludicola]|uniref:DUF4160 domain-containing protein n=1 Tax=Granulicella paludicola TaxID=474951 RepID=UPI0037C14D81